MAKLTLLEMVEDILSTTNGDEIESINASLDSIRCAYAVREAYLDMMAEMDYGNQGELARLEDATTVAKPVYLKIPDHVGRISFINYMDVPFVPLEIEATDDGGGTVEGTLIAGVHDWVFDTEIGYGSDAYAEEGPAFGTWSGPDPSGYVIHEIGFYVASSFDISIASDDGVTIPAIDAFTSVTIAGETLLTANAFDTESYEMGNGTFVRYWRWDVPENFLSEGVEYTVEFT